MLVLDPAAAPDGFADGQWSPSRRDLAAVDVSDDLAGRGPQPETLCHIFTERPVYRPEETVHIKGYLRTRDRRAARPRTRLTGKVVVEGPGDLVWRYPVTVTEAGSFYRAFDEKELPTGIYRAHFEDDERRTATASVSLQWRPTACRASRSASTRRTACRSTSAFDGRPDRDLLRRRPRRRRARSPGA